LLEFPGGELVSKGLRDLRTGIRSDESLLMLVAQPRLVSLGFNIEDPFEEPLPYEHRLYELLEGRMDRGAYAFHNALLERMCSFLNALDHVATRLKGSAS
jgi:hypothetical protein